MILRWVAALLLLAPAALTGETIDSISPERLAGRRDALRQAMGNGLAVVYGSREKGYQGFRQSSDFLYLTGIDFPGAALVLRAGNFQAEEEREVLYLPAQTDDQSRWVGPRMHSGSPEEDWRSAGFLQVGDVSALPGAIRDAARASGTGPFDLWLLYREGTPGEDLGEDLRRVRDLRDRFPQARVRPLRPLLVEMRQVKDPEEIELIRRAAAVTGEGLRRAMRALEPGLSEMELRAVVEGAFLEQGAPRTGFRSIVGSGPNASVLHYPAGHRLMEAGDLVVMDVGAEVAGGYGADVTRTLPVSGRFTRAQREIYDLVLRAQQAAMAAIRPGATLDEVHEAAKAVFSEAGYGESFWHNTSHWLGLDTHDVGERDRPLETGMVFTVEPGLYLPDEGFGIRIEDDVVVTRDGAEILSADIPRTAGEVERAMRR